MRGKSPRGPGKGPKKIVENLIFGKKDRKVCCEVPPYRLVYTVAQCW